MVFKEQYICYLLFLVYSSVWLVVLCAFKSLLFLYWYWSKTWKNMMVMEEEGLGGYFRRENALTSWSIDGYITTGFISPSYELFMSSLYLYIYFFCSPFQRFWICNYFLSCFLHLFVFIWCFLIILFNICGVINDACNRRFCGRHIFYPSTNETNVTNNNWKKIL